MNPLSYIPMSELSDDGGLSLMDPEDRWRELHRLERAAVKSATAPAAAPRPPILPADTTAAAGNELRPTGFDEIVGQERAKSLLRRIVTTAMARRTPLDHVLLVGPSGTGKTTFAHVIANELKSRVYQLEAPVSSDTLLELAQVMQDGDILFLDEIHQQAIGDRRGRQSATQPEVLFSIMEDFTMPTGYGVIPFPRVTIMGATTDEGALPDAFINRFPIRPQIAHYTVDDMVEISRHSVDRLGLMATPIALRTFAEASRGVPREVNNFVRNARMLTESVITPQLAVEVVCELNGYTLDGLTTDMQGMLTYLLTQPRTVQATGEVRYQASVNSVATAIGKSRDVKAIQLRVEPYLIRRGYVQVLHNGRILTDQGIERARQLQRS